ncbi:MAG: phage/plasmid primase, P4 family [Pseudorhodobacter sp.]|nr:phage/plasmid primase, P4 family [Pseudorhodobacter sp.]
MASDDDGFGDLPGIDDEAGFDDGFSGEIPPAPPETAEMAAQLATGATYDLNDRGNGQRFALYFGVDLIWVPRVGWFAWDGRRWAADPDDIALRRKAQLVAALIKREAHAIRLTNYQADLVAQQVALVAQRRALSDGAGAGGQGPAVPLDEASKKAIRDLDKGLLALGKELKAAGDPRPAHHRFAIQAGNSKRMTDMQAEAAVMLAHELTAMDADPLMINTLSGVLRYQISRDGDGLRQVEEALLPHDRAQLLTKIMPVTLDEDAECPEFDRFFARIQPDPDMRSFLLRWFALSMTGLVEQKLAFFYGMGANGKSVLVDLMARIMGDYAATAKIESLTGTNRRGGGDATPDLVPLIGARLVRAAEPDEGVRWQEGLIKDLTGGEPILVRALRADFVSVRPIFSLTINGNHKPDIRGTDDGIWRRLLLVPFDVTIPKAEQIPKAELDALLQAEAGAIFTHRLLPALREYLENGLQEPDSVLNATAEFREDSDPFGSFLDEACVVTGDAMDTVKTRDLTNAFHFWLLERSEGAFKDRTVSLALKDRSRRWVSRKTGRRFTLRKTNGQNVYDGIKLADLFGRRFDDAPKDQTGKPLGVPVYPEAPPARDDEMGF